MARDLYTSSNGDRWTLVAEDGVPLVEHRPNASSGGRATRLRVAEFLTAGHPGPQHEALLGLIAGLAAPSAAGAAPKPPSSPQTIAGGDLNASNDE